MAFDLARALDAVLMLRSEIPEEAFTAGLLGTDRAGYGVVIGEDGLTLTIGYLVTEAASIWLSSNRGTTVLEKSIIVGVGALAFFQDPEGNAFGAIQFDKAAE